MRDSLGCCRSLRPKDGGKVHTQIVCKWWIFTICLGIAELGCSASTGPARVVDQLAFRSLSDGGPYLQKPDGSGNGPIRHDNTGRVSMLPMWSPDGRSIAFH